MERRGGAEDGCGGLGVVGEGKRGKNIGGGDGKVLIKIILMRVYL